MTKQKRELVEFVVSNLWPGKKGKRYLRVLSAVCDGEGYLIDGNLAFEVIARMKKLGWFVTIECFDGFFTARFCAAKLPIVSAEHKDPAMAVMLAAREALREGEMNYEELSDRQLDALTAEKVIGWKQVRIEGQLLIGEPPHSPVGGFAGFALPSFTTDANDRDQVVEKMRELGWKCEINIYAVPNCAYEVRFSKSDSALLIGLINAETQGRAVCIAALKALEAK
jgi:hypothetical protein